MDTYEKKYKNALTIAQSRFKIEKDESVLTCLGMMFPELRESEDEKIRRTLVEYFGPEVQLDFVRGVPIQKIRDWLEKQKESLHIIETCKENADSFTNEDERIRKAALEGIEYLERKLGWDAIGDTDILDVKEYLEKQKENPKSAISIPADCATNAKCPYKIHGDEDFIGDIKDTPAYHFGFDEGVRSEREKQKEQKPAEWSGEDEKQLDDIISIIRGAYEHGITISETRHRNAYSWLNNLRPSWKPSEEQMDALKELIDDANRAGWVTPGATELYEQLLKLM